MEWASLFCINFEFCVIWSIVRQRQSNSAFLYFFHIVIFLSVCLFQGEEHKAKFGTLLQFNSQRWFLKHNVGENFDTGGIVDCQPGLLFGQECRRLPHQIRLPAPVRAWVWGTTDGRPTDGCSQKPTGMITELHLDLKLNCNSISRVSTSWLSSFKILYWSQLISYSFISFFLLLTINLLELNFHHGYLELSDKPNIKYIFECLIRMRNIW